MELICGMARAIDKFEFEVEIISGNEKLNNILYKLCLSQIYEYMENNRFEANKKDVV